MPNLNERYRVAGMLVGLTVLGACSGDEAKPADTGVAVPVVVDTPRAPRPGDPDCPRDGTWKTCALVDRLVSSGLAPKALPDTTRVAFFAAPGVRYQIGRVAILTAFIFADSNAAKQAVSGIDTVTVRMPGDSTAPWRSTPHLFRSANLVAVFESDNERQVERMMLALTAGAP
jgi:hypothetical protein